MKSKTRQEIDDQPEVARKVISDFRRVEGQVARELEAARNIILTGTGASLNACRCACRAFLRYGHALPTVVDAADIPVYLDRIPAGTPVVLVSQSGRSAETVVAAEAVADRGLRLWGVTNDPDSPLARRSARVFPLHSGVEVSSATKTFTASVVTLYLVAAGTDAGARRAIEGIPVSLEDTLRLSADPVLTLAAELDQAPGLLVAGVGALGPVAQQAALLMKEKALIQTEGMPIAELRHGTVEILRPGFPVLVVACGDRGRAHAAPHVSYLASIGARVWLAADGVSGEARLGFSAGPEEALCHPAATIPFQLLAETVARNRGYDVDGFRFLTKVVASYA